MFCTLNHEADIHLMSQLCCRQGNSLLETTDDWAAAYADLSRNAGEELRYIISATNRLLSGNTQQLLGLPALPRLKLPAKFEPVILQAESAGAAASDTSFQLAPEASRQLRHMWTSQQPATSPIFVVIQFGASANGFYQQLDVENRSAVQQFLRK